MPSKTLREILICLAIILIAGVVYAEASKIAPGRYDPLGGGTMPRAVAALVSVLALVVLAQTLYRHFRAPLPERAKPVSDVEATPQPFIAVLVFFWAVAMAVSLKLEVHYWISAPVFLFLAVFTVSNFRRGVIVPGVLFALFIGLGLNFLFGDFLYVDLP